MASRGLLILSRNRTIAILAVTSFAGLLAGCQSGTGQPVSQKAAAAVNVVAAENFYGDVAKQLGGPAVSVTSIISDPNADPHEYESSSADAKAIAAAKLVVENGAGYDDFMDKLLSASPSQTRTVLNAADLLGKKAGDNPHIWYDVAGMQQLADRITQSLQQIDPANSADFTTRSTRFKASLTPLLNRISAVKTQYAATHITQTEPVFGYMNDALGLQVDDGDFQHAIEAGNDPSPQSVAQIEQELTNHTVKALLYNSQTTSPVTTQVKTLAGQNGIPIVGISETEPPKMTYQSWMLSEVDALQRALGG